jgi:hypothetical protein
MILKQLAPCVAWLLAASLCSAAAQEDGAGKQTHASVVVRIDQEGAAELSLVVRPAPADLAALEQALDKVLSGPPDGKRSARTEESVTLWARRATAFQRGSGLVTGGVDLDPLVEVLRRFGATRLEVEICHPHS